VHIKFIRPGRSGQKAVAYLLKKRPDEEVIVRRGEPVFFVALVDSLGYKNPYSSAVIAFAPEDQPTEEQIEEVIEAFQRTAWAGLEDDDFCILVIEHRRKDGKGTHLHFLIAQHHISRKIHYNPAPPGWQKRYDLLRDYLNLKYRWARPDDEKRARKVIPGYLAFPGVAAEKRQVLAWAEAIAEMGLGAGEIAEVARASGAEVVRMGPDYITLAWGKQRVRVRIEKKEKKEEKKEVETPTIEEQKTKWQRALERLATKNRERYEQKGERENGRRNRTSVTGAGQHRVRGVPAWSATGEEPGSKPGNMVVLPAHVRMDVGRGPGAGVPRRVQRLGRSAKIPRIKQGGGEHGIRIQWARQKGNGATAATDGGDGTPAKGIGSLDGTHHGGTRGAASAAGRPEPGMAGVWAALERLLRCLGSANATVGRLYTAAHRLVAAEGMRPARGAEQAGQQLAARREEPGADVPKRGWPPAG